MPPKKAEKKESFGWMFKLAGFFSELVETLIAHSDAEIEKIKKKVLNYFVVYGLFTIALFFLLVGLVKYLAEIYFFRSEGIGFMITGSVIIVLLAAYSLIKRI